MSVTLLHGDCLDLLPTLPAQSVDLVLADLPYAKTGCAWDSLLPLDVLWREYRRVLKPCGAVVLTAAVWLVYALVLHSPINPSFRGRKTALLSVVGVVLMFGTIVAVNLVGGSGGTH